MDRGALSRRGLMHATPRGDGAGCQVVTREIKHQMSLYSTKLIPDLLELAPLLEVRAVAVETLCVRPGPVGSAEADRGCG